MSAAWRHVPVCIVMHGRSLLLLASGGERMVRGHEMRILLPDQAAPSRLRCMHRSLQFPLGGDMCKSGS